MSTVDADGLPEWFPLVGSLGKAVAVAAIAFLAAVVTVNLGILPFLAAGVVEQETMAWNILASVLQFIGFGVGVAAYFAVSGEWDVISIRVPTLRDAAWIGAGVLVILLAAQAIGLFLQQLDIQVAQNTVIAAGQENPEFFLYMIPVSLLLVGPFEELVFRGGVQGVLRRAWGPRGAVVVAAVLFGLVHWIALVGSGSRISYVLVAAALGLILGAIYERTRNLVVPAVVHGLYNSVLFAVQYATATGMV
jgi:hypothetical protein